MGLSRGRQARVHLRSGQTLEGVLIRKKIGGYLVLELASYIEADEGVELAGRVKVPRENVAFIQELT